jgi:2-keto-4-pentenoate hydratase/2-oxohepta-3-ene-1,7-dioic acid hydratase in catechol pathway
MKLASFHHDGVSSWGVVVDDSSIADTGSVLRASYPDLKSAISSASHQELVAAAARAPRLPLSSIDWLPVIPNPARIFCIGVNYDSHRREMGRDEVPYPTIFTRWPSSQIGHLQNLVLPRVSTSLDFEGELAVIIGKGGRYISAESAFDHVAGYSCYHDGSVRDWQRHTTQFTPGKNFPGTGGFGPWLVTRDEIVDGESLRLKTTLNGQVVQDATTDMMINTIPQIIAYCSSFTPLEPGDVIATGTPGGVGAARQPPLFMKPGDVAVIEIEKIGKLVNTVAAEAI